MARRSEAHVIYQAAALWKEKCLFGDDAVLAPGERLWGLENLRALRQAFTGNPLSGSDEFLTKFRSQVGTQPRPVVHLAAEMLWILFLFPRKLLGVGRKRELVTTVWNWVPPELGPGHFLLADDVLAGIGSAGTAFNTQRDRELEALIDIVIAIKRTGLSADAPPDAVAEVIDALPAARARNIRHILLHLLYPGQFERIASLPHKRDILRAFAATTPPTDAHLRRHPIEADHALRQVRRELEERFPGREIDFYDEDLRLQWARTKEPDPPPPPTPLLHPDTATREELLTIRGIDALLATTLVGARPYDSMMQVDRLLGRLGSKERRVIYTRLWKPLDVNNATREELLLIPGVGPLLATEIQGARPYRDAAHFRAEVGRNVPAADLARLERYLAFRPASASATPQAIAGLSAAQQLASQAGLTQPSPDLLLAAFLLLAPDTKYSGRTSIALSRAMGETLRIWGEAEVRPANFLLRFRGLEVVVKLEPAETIPPGPFAQGVLDAAADIRQRVSDGRVEGVSARHVLAVLLLPGPYSAVPVLAEFGFTAESLRRVLLESLVGRRLDESHDAWTKVLTPLRHLEAAAGALYAGFSADAIGTGLEGITRADDRLGVLKDVTALCEVLAARQTRPPLAVGLFGDWGTGKSFFMELMRKEIEALGRQNPAFYCERVVQVWFNAWHYMDTNLWASLAARVFEELAEQPRRWEPDEDVRASLFQQLQESSGVLAQAMEEKKDAEARIEGIQEQREASRRSLVRTAEIAVAAAAATLDQDPEVQAQLRAAQKRLGLDDAQASAEQARSQARAYGRVLRRLAAMAAALRREPRFLLAGIILFAAVTGGALWALRRADALEGAVRWIAVAAAWAAGGLAALAPTFRYVSRAVGWLEDVGRRLEQQRQAEERQEDLAFQREMMRLDEREGEVRARVEELTREIDELRAGRRLQRFIMERHASAEYRQHLGIVNLIRNDFEQLSKLLSAAEGERQAAEKAVPPAEDGAAGQAENTPKAPLPQVDRIVLYIDDLDRCPEDRVVEVLQAVHLLLAFPLFVVVVGVDSRWLLLSLEDHYTALRGRTHGQPSAERPAEEGWSTTPQNYLEKIFQIPFTLRPMEQAGFASLVEALLPVEVGVLELGADGTGPAETASPMPAGASQGAATEAAASPAASAASGDGGEEEEEEEEEEEDGGVGEDTPALPPNPQGLTVDAQERELIQRLHPLIASPRALKRFTNVYRFLRVQQRGGDLQRFRGADGSPGEFQVAAVLLAALVGYPAEATHLLHAILTTPSRPWWSLVEGGEWARAGTDGGTREDAEAEADAARRAARRAGRPALREVLLALRPVVPLTGHPPDTFARWTREVARFSFQSGRILSVRPHEEEAA